MEQNKEMPKIKNLPDYAKDCRYIVTKICNGETWFCGAYNKFYEAANAFQSIKGQLYDTIERVCIYYDGNNMAHQKI